MKSHRAENPNTSILPDRVLSNMSDEEDEEGENIQLARVLNNCSVFFTNGGQM